MPVRPEVGLGDPRVGVVGEVARAVTPLLAGALRVHTVGDRGHGHVRDRGQHHPPGADRADRVDQPAVLQREVGRPPDVVAALAVDRVVADVGPVDDLVDHGAQRVVGPVRDDQGVDAAVGAQPGRGVDLRGGGSVGGEHGARGQVAVVGRNGAEQVVVRGRARQPGGGKAGRVGQAVAHVPAVDAEVGVADVGGWGDAALAAFPVVLVVVGQPVQGEGELDELERVEPVAELVLQAPQQTLDVERQPTQRPGVGRYRQVDLQAAGHDGGPGQVGVEHRSAGQAMGQRVADGDQAVLGGGSGRRRRTATPSVGSGKRGRTRSVTSTSGGVRGSRYSGRQLRQLRPPTATVRPPLPHRSGLR